MVVAETEGHIVKNAVGWCHRGDGAKLLCEVIRVRGRLADLQVFEETRGLRVGDRVDFQEDMLSVTLGPGLLGQVYEPCMEEAAGWAFGSGTVENQAPESKTPLCRIQTARLVVSEEISEALDMLGKALGSSS